MTGLANKIRAIACANLLFSSYCNGFSRVASPSSKKVLTGAREALLAQLEGLEKFLSDKKTQVDEELVRNSVKICVRYLEYFRMVLADTWKREVEEAERMNLENLPLCVIAKNESVEVLRDYLLRASQECSEPDGRLSLLLQRYVVGSHLFREVASVLMPELGSAAKDYLTRSIVFPPEAKQAGMAILAYFGEVIEKKYPTIECNVRIEQTGNKVSLIIETPNGEIEKIEHELSQYSLVVTGKMQPEEFMPRSLDALALKQKLQLAELEIRQTKELLHIERTGFERRIESLEDQIGFMRRILDKTQYEAAQASAVVRSIAQRSVEEVATILKTIADRLESEANIDPEQLTAELQDAEKRSPGVLSQLNELLVKGAIQGAAGNYLYAAIAALQRMI